MKMIDPVNGSWMSLNAKSAGERSVTLAILIMSANTAGIIGSQLFQSEDGPLYRAGWTAILLLLTVALFASIIANAQYGTEPSAKSVWRRAMFLLLLSMKSPATECSDYDTLHLKYFMDQFHVKNHAEFTYICAQ